MDPNLVAPEPPEARLAPAQAPGAAITPLASYLHTAFLVVLMIGVGVMSAMSFKQGTAPTNPLALYIPTIIWLWSLVLIVYAGVRMRGHRLRDVFGRTWQSFDDALMDAAVAAGFWLGAMIVLVGLAYGLMRLTRTPVQLPSEMSALTPQGLSGAVLWIVLSVSAGICEELVFRGYLQRQFAALTNNWAGGIVFSALIFSVGHLYEGALRASVIGIFGIMLGTLAYVRRSLAPGVIAHILQDLIAGLLLIGATQHH